MSQPNEEQFSVRGPGRCGKRGCLRSNALFLVNHFSIARVMGADESKIEEHIKRFEAAQDDSTALLSVEPELSSGKLRLIGEARDGAALLAYIARLEGRGGITDVSLLSQQVKQCDVR